MKNYFVYYVGNGQIGIGTTETLKQARCFLNGLKKFSNNLEWKIENSDLEIIEKSDGFSEARKQYLAAIDFRNGGDVMTDEQRIENTTEALEAEKERLEDVLQSDDFLTYAKYCQVLSEKRDIVSEIVIRKGSCEDCGLRDCDCKSDGMMTDEQREDLNFIADTMIDIELEFVTDTIDDYTRQIIFLLVKKMTDHDVFVEYHISRIAIELAALLATDDLSEGTREPVTNAFSTASALLATCDANQS